MQGPEGIEHEDIGGSLGRMDGVAFYANLLWRLPPGKDIDQVSPETDAQEYLQCAGSAQAMTVELRRIIDGRSRHFVIGRPERRPDGPPSEVIRWDAFTTRIYPNEVFVAAEAAVLFTCYYETDDIPATYQLRELDL